jgi:hypothetical protein
LFLETAMPSHLDFWTRALPRRCPPFFRLPTTSRLLAWLLASTLTAPSLAQPAHASDGATAPAPLRYPALLLQSPQAPTEGDWVAANRAVAEFPRGHADIVSWEATAAMPAASPAASAGHKATSHGSPHSAEQHDMQSMHKKMHPTSQGAKPPISSGNHTDHHTTPKGGRP